MLPEGKSDVKCIGVVFTVITLISFLDEEKPELIELGLIEAMSEAKFEASVELLWTRNNDDAEGKNDAIECADSAIVKLGAGVGNDILEVYWVETKDGGSFIVNSEAFVEKNSNDEVLFSVNIEPDLRMVAVVSGCK